MNRIDLKESDLPKNYRTFEGYESKLYKFTTDHAAGAWDVSDVTEVTVSDDLEKTYKTDDATESAIVDADYIPFYDSSASVSKKSTWSNFCNKIAAKLFKYVQVDNIALTTSPTTVTFSDAGITADSVIDVYTSEYGISKNSETVSNGAATVIFSALTSGTKTISARVYYK